MEKTEFLRKNFDTLREEIKSTKSRLFWIVAMGLFGVPIVARWAEGGGKFVTLLIPYLVFVIIIMFLAEQNALMRAGRYIRLVVEPEIKETLGWEVWLESRNDLRLMDKHFVACFIIVFFVYYFMSVGAALQPLLANLQRDPSARWWVIGTSVTYGIGAIWAVSTLLHHWRSCTGTSDKNE